MKIEDLTICPAWMDCFIAKKNKNGTMSVQRKALTDNEMLEVVAFYGSNRLETGYKQDLPLRDGTKVVIVHTEGDKDVKTEKPIWHTLDEKADLSKSILMYDVDGNYMSPPVRCPFSFDDFFVKTMNKKYGANYTMWAYMDDIKPKATYQPSDEINQAIKGATLSWATEKDEKEGTETPANGDDNGGDDNGGNNGNTPGGELEG